MQSVPIGCEEWLGIGQLIPSRLDQSLSKPPARSGATNAQMISNALLGPAVRPHPVDAGGP